MINELKIIINNIQELFKTLMPVKSDVNKSTNIRNLIADESNKAVNLIISNLSSFKWKQTWDNHITAELSPEIKSTLQLLYTHEESNMAKTCNISKKIDSLTTLYIFANNSMQYITICVDGFEDCKYMDHIISNYKLQVS